VSVATAAAEDVSAEEQIKAGKELIGTYYNSEEPLRELLTASTT